jgi:hypothetical protein
MLDYAANAVAYWPVEAIRACFEEVSTRWLSHISRPRLRFAPCSQAYSVWRTDAR